MRKFYNEVWRLAVHFRESINLDEFKKSIAGEYGRVKIIHETDDFVLLETDKLINFARLADVIVRSDCEPTFLTIKQVFK